MDKRGLYLKVSSSGGKWWRLRYRFAGKEKRLSLGVYPDVGLKDAGERRDAARKLLADGIDPSQNRRSAKLALGVSVANSFELITREWFARYSADWADAHAIRIIRLFERDIFPWIGVRPVSEITAPELLAVIRRIEDRGARDTAHRALGNCGQAFRYAIATDVAIAIPLEISEVRCHPFEANTSPQQQSRLNSPRSTECSV